MEVWTFSLQYPSFLFPGKTQYSNEEAPRDLRIRRCLNSCNPIDWFFVGHALRRQKPDMLICCYWMAFFAPAYGTVCRIVRRNHHTRCIALVHNMFPHEKGMLDRLFAPWFVRCQDAFVALSESVVEQIHTLTKVPACSSPHPIYDHYGERMPRTEASKALGLKEDGTNLLFFGLVRAYKGLDLLLDALSIVQKRLPMAKWQLVIAGEFYEDEDKYRAQIADNGLTDKVIVHNEFIADADLRKYFGAADLIVQPYKSATQSGVTQVAFHFEKPMLVTNVGGLGEIVHDRKMGYAVAADKEAIADALVDYMSNDRQEKFVEYLRKEKTKYGWERLTKAFQDMYQTFYK